MRPTYERCSRRVAAIAERMIDAGKLIVVMQAETHRERKGDGKTRPGDSRCDPELQIRSRVLSAVRLSQPGSRVELESEQRMRTEDESARRAPLVGREPEAELLDGAE